MSTTTVNPTNMSAAGAGAGPTLRVTKSVFDVKDFDTVKLVREVPAPAPATSYEEALSRVGNDSARLLAAINKGLLSQYRDEIAEATTGWLVEGEDGELTPYAGSFANEESGESIKKVIGQLCSIQGSKRELPKDQKKAIREKVLAGLRANPAMLAMLVPGGVSTETATNSEGTTSSENGADL